MYEYRIVSQTGFCKEMSSVSREENAYWWKIFINGHKFVCMNLNSCGDVRH